MSIEPDVPVDVPVDVLVIGEAIMDIVDDGLVTTEHPRGSPANVALGPGHCLPWPNELVGQGNSTTLRTWLYSYTPSARMWSPGVASPR